MSKQESRDTKRQVSSEQLHFESGVAAIIREIEQLMKDVPLPTRLLIAGNLIDLMDAVKDSYGNGRYDQRCGR